MLGKVEFWIVSGEKSVDNIASGVVLVAADVVVDPVVVRKGNVDEKLKSSFFWVKLVFWTFGEEPNIGAVLLVIILLVVSVDVIVVIATSNASLKVEFSNVPLTLLYCSVVVTGVLVRSDISGVESLVNWITSFVVVATENADSLLSWLEAASMLLKSEDKAEKFEKRFSSFSWFKSSLFV